MQIFLMVKLSFETCFLLFTSCRRCTVCACIPELRVFFLFTRQIKRLCVCVSVCGELMFVCLLVVCVCVRLLYKITMQQQHLKQLISKGNYNLETSKFVSMKINCLMINLVKGSIWNVSFIEKLSNFVESASECSEMLQKKRKMLVVIERI